jgi:hypothetical protein
MSSFNVNAESWDRYTASLVKYMTMNRKTVPELVKHKAQSMAKQLFRECRDVAPTPGQIAQDVTSRGWVVKRYMKRKWPLAEGETRGSDGPLHRMQAQIIKERTRSILSVAAGWLPAVKALRARVDDQGQALRAVRRPRGRAEIVVGDSEISVTIINNQRGIEKVQAKHQVLEKAIAYETDDIDKYINDPARKAARDAIGG